jgi:hypothetical protein
VEKQSEVAEYRAVTSEWETRKSLQREIGLAEVDWFIVQKKGFAERRPFGGDQLDVILS